MRAGLPVGPPMVDGNGNAMRDGDGKIRWQQLNGLFNKNVRDAGSSQITQAIHTTYPDGRNVEAVT